MTGAEIVSALKPYVPDGATLRLPDTNTLGSPAINTLLDAFFGKTLAAAVQAPVVGATSATYTAKLQTAGFTLYTKAPVLAATLTFYTAPTSGALALTVQVTLPPGFGLTDSFPVLSATTSPLASLTLETATYTVDSTFAANTVQLQATLSPTDGLLAVMTWAAGGALTMGGTITVTTSPAGTLYPAFNLTSSQLTSPTLSGFTLDATVGVVAVVVPAAVVGGEPQLLTVAQLVADLVTPALTIPIVVTLEPGQNLLDVRLNRQAPPPSISALSSVAGFAGGTDPSGPLVSAQTPIGALSLDWVSCTIDTQYLQIRDLQIEVGLGTNWPIVDKILTLQGLTAVFVIADPQNAPSVSVTVTAEFVLPSGSVDVYVTYPSTVVGLQLAAGSVIDLNDLIGAVAKGVTLPGTGDLDIVALDAVANIGASTYTFTVEASGALTVVPGFVINDINLEIDYTGSLPPAFAFGCIFAIAKTELYLSVSYSGTYWTFSGGTYQQGSINLSDLAASLLSIFGVQLPADLPDIVLSDLQLVNYSTLDGSFAFEAEIDYIGGNDALLKSITGKVNIASTMNGSQRQWTGGMSGAIDIGGNQFTVAYDFATSQTLTASWTGAQGQTFGIASLCTLLGATPPAIPQGLDLGLTQVTFTYNITTQTVLLTASSLNYGNAVFYSTPAGASRLYAFGVNVPLNVTLADIPLVGDKLPDADQLGIANIGAWLLSSPILQAQAQAIDKALAGLTAYPSLPPQDIDAPLNLFGNLLLGTDVVPLSVPLGAPAPGPALPAGAVTVGTVGVAPPPAAPSDGTRWFSVQKTLGIFSFQRIGIQYVSDGSNALFIALDASIVLGPLTLTMNGLAVGSPLTSFTPTFHLSGLGLSYVQPPLEIAGQLLAVPANQLAPNTTFQYDGFAVVQAETFGLAAIGSYGQLTSGDPSLFLFAQLEMPLGGPPAFFVTGLMGGFGFNRALAIPAQDQVLGFPLLVLGAPSGPGQPAAKQDMTQVLAILEGQQPITPNGTKTAWIAPQSGAYWLAVGVTFTSFEVMTTRAVLIAEFGNDFVLALLGLSTLSLPQSVPAAETYAYVELELEAIFRPQQGVFSLTAVVSSNSYVIAPACHLTGGFAFYAWFGSNIYAGQFVVTLGGYHPAFNPPSYFPVEPRLGFNWAVSDLVSIKGDAYFALTPSCVMAGGGLQVLFQSGNLRAWFTAQADFLIAWNPFFFVADIGVSIGVSYRLDIGFVSKTLTVSVGATVNMWGPPTGGTVMVHLWFVSFSVDFGASQVTAANTALLWPGFQPLLPAQNTICTVSVTSGLMNSLDDPTIQGQKIWVVRATSFTFATEAAVPSTQFVYGGPSGGGNTTVSSGFTLDIRPMNLTGVVSTHTVTMQDTDTGTPVNVSTWAPAAWTRSVPQSLWGAPLTDASGKFTQQPQQATAAMVPSAPVGVTLQLPPPALNGATGVVPLSQLAYEPVSPPGGGPVVVGQSPLAIGAATSSDFLPSFATTTIANIEQVATGTAAANRNAMYIAMSGATVGLYAGTNDPMTALAQDANDLFADFPLAV